MRDFLMFRMDLSCRDPLCYHMLKQSKSMCNPFPAIIQGLPDDKEPQEITESKRISDLRLRAATKNAESKPRIKLPNLQPQSSNLPLACTR